MVPQRGFSDKSSEFSIFLAWPAILDIYSHGLLKLPPAVVDIRRPWIGVKVPNEQGPSGGPSRKSDQIFIERKDDISCKQIFNCLSAF